MMFLRICIQLFWIGLISWFCLQFTSLWGILCIVPGLTLLVIFAVYDYRRLKWEMQRITAQQQAKQRQRTQQAHPRQGQQAQAQAQYRAAQQRDMQMAYIDDLMWEDGLLDRDF